MSEQLGSSEVREDIKFTMLAVENFLAGKFSDSFPDDESLDPREVFSGPLLDLNDETISPREKEIVAEWIEKKVLKDNLETAPVGKVLVSPDQDTTVRVYTAGLGQADDPWFLSVWQNKGERPSYILWPEEMYDMQEEMGYTRVDSASDQP